MQRKFLQRIISIFLSSLVLFLGSFAVIPASADTTASSNSDEINDGIPSCANTIDVDERCIIFVYETAEEEDPLDHSDLSIAAVGQALEQGEIEVAKRLVRERAETKQDFIQRRIQSLIDDGLPRDSINDPEIHPSSGVSRVLDQKIGVLDVAMPTDVTPFAVKNPYKEVTKTHLKWACSCGGTVQNVKVAEQTHLEAGTYGIFQVRKTDLVKGVAYDVKSNDCRVRYERSNAPDTTVHNWNNCWNWTSRTWSDDVSTTWSFQGTKGAKYHSDWKGSITPRGLGSKNFNLRGSSWKYPSGGGKPSF